MNKVKNLPPHVTKLSNGKTRVRYRKTNKYPFEYNKIFDNEEEALKANEEYLAKLTLNLVQPNSIKKIGFSDFCDYYINWYINKAKKPSHNTIKGYISKINHLKTIFKNQNINEIAAYQIEMVLSQEKNRTKISNGSNKNDKINDNTLHHEYTMLRILFNKAYNWHFISSNPINEVEEPTFQAKEIIVPDYEELEKIEDTIYQCENIRDKCQFLLAFYTGIREEEVCGIHLEDFNEEVGYVSIKRAIVQHSITKQFIEDKTKSQKSIRKVPLPQKFFNVLHEYYKYRKNFIEFIKYKTNGSYIEKQNVFLNKDGDFYRPYRISRKWDKYSKLKNIPLTFHGLRHYYLTNQMNYNEKLTPRDVQAIAGHSNINTTFKYVHPSYSNIQNNATNLFNKFTRDSLYRKNSDLLYVPISHIATIILGNSKLSKIEELKITLEELTNEKIDFFNISCIMEKCKEDLLEYYPSLARIEKYQFSSLGEKEIINSLKNEFGKDFPIEKNFNKSIKMSI